MTNSDVRVRFAPSPTGYLHVGGARTALFNWLYARKVGGKMLLRIEDTDKARSSEEHTQVILDGMTWLGLDWDEEIVFQAAGVKEHAALGEKLLADGKAYEDEGAIRFRMPDEEIAWEDAVHDRVSFMGSDIKDFIILRSDRTPTYNFSVVCDDISMGMTHVLRGDDHISNTPKQIAVYRALGADVPVFGHLPMIHGMDGKKLSKRHGATAVGDYRNEGILPGAMRNFLALLGWSPGNDRELFYEIEEMIDAFSLDGIQKKAAIFDTRKLEWMNGQHISNSSPATLLATIKEQLAERGLTDRSDDELEHCIARVSERSRTTGQLADQVINRLTVADIELDEKGQKLIAKDPEGFTSALSAVAEALEALPAEQWNPDGMNEMFSTLGEQMGLGLGKLMQPVRVALTGGTVSEPVTELLPLVGRTESLRRIRNQLG